MEYRAPNQNHARGGVLNLPSRAAAPNRSRTARVSAAVVPAVLDCTHMRATHHRIAGVTQRAALAIVVAFSGACAAPDAIAWDAERRVDGAMAPGVTLVLDDAGVPAIREPWTPLRWPDDSSACAGTRVAARGRGDTAVAAWWRATAARGLDPSGQGLDAELVVARADDGVSWGEPRVAGRAAGRACPAFPASVTVDETTGDAHVVYHGKSAAGLGIHRVTLQASAMTAGPVLVDSGAAPRRAAVAARGDTVAVAFETRLNGSPDVWLALSLASGHIPDIRGGVSPRGGRAFAPAVALRDAHVAVAWNEPRRGATPPAAAVRVGRIRR